MKNNISIIFTCLALFGVFSCQKGSEQQTATISSLEDFDGKTISVLAGSVQDLLLSENCPNSEILRCDTETDIFTMINAGKSCGALHSSISWSIAEKNFPEIVTVGEPMAPQPIGFAFCKENKELLAEFNVFLKEFLAENDISEFTEAWKDEEVIREMPSAEDYSGENGVLHFAVSAITPPFEFIREGEVVGIEPEILARFAISKGMKWDFANVSFSGLITYIQTGKAVGGCSIMCITPERQESVDFSEPWTSETSVIIVNRKYAPDGSADGSSDEDKSFFQKISESFTKSLIKEDRYKMILKGLESTVIISLLAALFGTLLGMLLCFLSMRRNRMVAGPVNVFIEFMRCMPQVVFLMIMFYVVFGKSSMGGEGVAVIAFSLCFAAYTSVIFRTSVQSIDKGQTEAALSLGFSRFKAFTNVILPQAVQRALPVYKGEFIGLVKATSIVGYIAVFDLTKAGDIIRSRTYEAFFPLILVTVMYFLVIWVLTISLKYIEAKTQPKRKKFFK